MASQHTQSQTPKTRALPCIVGFGLFVLGNVNAATAHLSCPLGSVANRALEVLESVVLAAISQALQDCIFDQQQLLQSFAQSLISLWLLLFVIAAAVVLRAVFGRNTGDRRAPGQFFQK